MAVDAVEVLAGDQVQALLGAVSVEPFVEDGLSEGYSQVGPPVRLSFLGGAAFFGTGWLSECLSVQRYSGLFYGSFRFLVAGASGLCGHDCCDCVEGALHSVDVP